MSKINQVCPLMSGDDPEREFVECIGSDCALWADDMDGNGVYGCCSLACAGMAYNMQHMLYRDPAVGGDEE